MRLVADLHIHSRYSLATSPKLTPPRLERWARIKGIDLLGTGDCTHPAWLAELSDLLEPAADGLFRLKDGARRDFDAGEALIEGLPDPDADGNGSFPRFALTGEVCTIYSRDGKTRKVHHLVILPDFIAAEAFQKRLERIGKIESDGRPILGLDSRDLFEMLLESDDRSILVPAHIWTPWFSALGARSGFDSIDECYRDLAPRIGAIETGLSSNPPMNWAVSALDRFAVISNSDAHSPEKLGREATLIEMEESYAGLAEALSGGGARGSILGTIEFFPQEGKYHYDGHRACGVALAPEHRRADGLCPVCGKPLTPGVLRRVCELADRPVDEAAPCPDEFLGTNRRPYRSLIPLKEILAELLETSESSKKVAAAYRAIVERGGSEFGLLLDLPEGEIEGLRAPGLSGELLALAIGRMRAGRIEVKPGYDGEYGAIRVFAPGERFESKRDSGLFTPAELPARAKNEKTEAARKPPRASLTSEPRSVPLPKAAKVPSPPSLKDASNEAGGDAPFRLDPDQERAVRHPGGPALIVAGPGTGKTAVLAHRIERLVGQGFDPGEILALTFTNKAAAELRRRIALTIGEEKAGRLTAATFHSFCRSVLRERYADAGIAADFSILDEDERTGFLEAAAKESVGAGAAMARRLGTYIEERKRFLLRPGERVPLLGSASADGLGDSLETLKVPLADARLEGAYAAYRDALKDSGSLDFDDLVAGTVRLLAARPEALAAYRSRYRFLFVDEYQDVNFAQYALVRLLAPPGPGQSELCVIGDPNQAIYGFRGADKRFIDRFLVDYPDASIYRLNKSFRCAPTIIGAAGRLVGAELVGSGAPVVISRSEAATEKAEAELIARTVDRLIGGTRFFAFDSKVADSRVADLGPAHSRMADATAAAYFAGPPPEISLRSLGECAILVRAAALAQPIEKALRDHGIPYVLVGERPWWEEEPGKALIRSLRSPDFRRSHGDARPSEALRSAVSELERDGVAVDADIVARLAASASLHRDLSSFLDSLTLGSPQDGLEDRLERVALMTIHAAKGLEFDHVFVAGLEEGILPFTLYDGRGADHHDAEASSGDDAGIEEERRLLYVAMTRARVGLHLSSARSRVFRGRPLALPPSRFIAEIEDLLSRQEAGRERPPDPQLALF